MRSISTLLVSASILTAGPALAQSMPNMPGMKQAPAQAKTGNGTGVITAIDARASTVTIKHGAIPAVGWPAMTMTFKATPPSLLRGLRVGQEVRFETKVQGISAEVTAVRLQ